MWLQVRSLPTNLLLFILIILCDHKYHHHNSSYRSSVSFIVDSFLFYDSSSSTSTGDERPAYSYSEDWTAEELWPKNKSTFLHVKLVRPTPKDIPNWELRNKEFYLTDPSLDFDSPVSSESVSNCLIEYKYVDQDGLLQVQISGAECFSLPLASLHSLGNLTHLLIRDTGLVNLTKFLFGAAKLDKLTRIDIVDNPKLRSINGRAFDGLTHLSYLSLINNQAITDINIEMFVGLKSLQELIWIDNNKQHTPLSYDAFLTLIRASSVRILPNLIHLHISGSQHQDKQATKQQNSQYSTTTARSVSDIEVNVHYNEKESEIDLKNNFDAQKSGREEEGEEEEEREGERKEGESSGLKINKDDFNSLTHLKYLQLSHCDIRSFHPLSFLPFRDKLIGLNLAGNSYISSRSLKLAIYNAFQVNSSGSVIDKLDISGVKTFSSLPKDLLSVISKTKVSQLYMNNLPVREIVLGDVPPMPRLKVLSLQFSQLESIEESALSLLENLERLSLRGNFLRIISSTFVSDLPKLEYLDLSGYKERRTSFEIPHKTFIGTQLKEVNLSYKLLDPLPRNAFLGLFKMQRCHLRGCGLKFVEYLTFFPLKSIVYIDLSENNDLISTLRETHEDSFFGLEAVQMLRMSDCNLTSNDINDINDNIFKRIHEHVTMLDLSRNHIDRLTATTFSNFSELIQLDLSHNSIQPWTNFSVFSQTKYMTTLDISANRITHFTSSMLEDWHRLKNLSFALNPIWCECKSHIIMDWLSDNPDIHYLQNRHPLMSKSQYYCISPEEGNQISLHSFVSYCKTHSFGSSKVSLAVLSAITSAMLFFALIVLILAFIYHSTLNSLFSGIDEDPLHHLSYQYDAFVSYNVNDSEWVFKQLVPNLEAHDSELNRIKLCVYDRDFIAGRPISECILESIKTSRKVILVISNNFVRSPWCRFETDLAHNTLTDENRDGLIMIKLEELEYDKVGPQLHFLLKTRIYLQWEESNIKGQEIFWRKLRRALGFIHRHHNSQRKTAYWHRRGDKNKPLSGHSKVSKTKMITNNNISNGKTKSQENEQLKQHIMIGTKETIMSDNTNSCNDKNLRLDHIDNNNIDCPEKIEERIIITAS